jgi:LysM repeat protein
MIIAEKKMKNLTFLIASLILLSFFLAPVVSAQETQKITLKEYQTLLEQWIAREATAKQAIAFEELLIDSLKTRYSMTEEEIARIQQEIYDMLGAYEADIANYKKELEALGNQLNSLRALTPELLYQKQDDLKNLEQRQQQLLESPLAIIPENQKKLSQFNNEIATLKANVPAPVKKMDTYTVQKGECLWNIAKKPDIYNDPFKWPRIWSANAESIKDPDVIEINQVLNIIRELEKNQHLVVKGEDLHKIAGSYGDPFAWTKIYEANKNQIKDPNVIYPEQIFVIPSK